MDREVLGYEGKATMALKLNLGCWHTWRDDAVNVDDRLDPSWSGRRGWFVKDRMTTLEDLFHCDSVDEMWANDVLSGRSYPEVARMLASWFQILKPGAPLNVLFDARISLAFLVGLLRELGYTVKKVDSEGRRWMTVEAAKDGIH